MNFSNDFGLGFNEGFDNVDLGGKIPEHGDGCTQCGLCLSSCPTFKISGDIRYSPMGRIQIFRNIKEDSYQHNIEDYEALESCLECRTCETVCPSKVPYAELLASAKSSYTGKQKKSIYVKLILLLAQQPLLFKSVSAVSKVFVPLLLKLEKLYKSNNTPAIFLSFRYLKYANLLLGLTSSRDDNLHDAPCVSLFTGCMSSVFDVPVLRSSINVLKQLGVDVVIPEDQACCGALHLHNAENKKGMELALRNINTFNDANSETIITTASGCSQMLSEYGSLADNELTCMSSSATRFSNQITDVSEFIVQKNLLDNLQLNPLNKVVVIHTPCTASTLIDQQDPVTQLLSKIPGLTIKVVSSSIYCCGAGGSHLITHGNEARKIREDLLSELIDLDADIFVTSNVGCSLHIKEGLGSLKQPIEVLHPVQLLESAML